MLRVSHVFIPNSRQTMGTQSQRPWFVTDSKKPKLSDAPRIARAIRASPKQTMKQIVWGLQTTETHLSKVLVYVIFPKIVLNIPRNTQIYCTNTSDVCFFSDRQLRKTSQAQQLGGCKCSSMPRRLACFSGVPSGSQRALIVTVRFKSSHKGENCENP